MRSLILLFTSSSFYCILLHLAAAQQQQQGDEIISNNDTIRVEAGISANGLRAGSPTNIKFFFGHEVEEEWQDDDDGVGVVGVPESSSDRMGLVRIGNGTRLILDFGPEFIYNQREARQPDANILVDLGVAENNFIYGSPCPYKYVGNEGAAPTTIDEETRIRRKAMSCGQWTAAFGSSKNQIVIRGSEEQGFQSTRMKEIGIKVCLFVSMLFFPCVIVCLLTITFLLHSHWRYSLHMYIPSWGLHRVYIAMDREYVLGLQHPIVSMMPIVVRGNLASEVR